MADTKGITTLQSVVAEVMNDLNETSLHDWKRYMQWAIRGFKKLNMLYMNSFQTHVGTVTSINTLDMPDDYVDYTKIGYVVGNLIYPISRNNNILLPFAESCGEEVIGEGMDSAQPIINYTWLAAPKHVYDVAFQRYDRKYNRFVLQGSFEQNMQMVVEYISSGIRLNGETYVPEIAKEAIIAFVHWQKRDFDGEAENRVNRAYLRFVGEVDTVNDLDWSMTPDEFVSLIESGKSQLP